MRTCPKCLLEKPDDAFDKDKKKCKECKHAYYLEHKEKFLKKSHEYYHKNKERISKSEKEYRKKNADKIRQRNQEYRRKNKEKVKEHARQHYFKNKKRIAKSRKEYRQKYKEEISKRRKQIYRNDIEKSRKKGRERHKKEYGDEKKRKQIKARQKKWRNKNPDKLRLYNKKTLKNNINLRIAQALRSRIRHALDGKRKAAHTLELLGCSIDEFKSYISSKFYNGMTWENHGFYTWHLDHIISCASFDLSIPEEQRKCFHYTNYQPLEWRENLIKSDNSYVLLPK